MAEFPHLTKLLLHPPPPSLTSPLIFPPFLSPLHNFSSSFSSLRRRRRLSLSSSASPNLLLISTSVKSDGSLVFKFGDPSEVPPPAVDDDDGDCGTMSVDEEIEVESVVESGDDLAVIDQVNSVGNVVVVDDDDDDISTNEFPESNEISKDDEHNHDDDEDDIATNELPESNEIASDDEHNRNDLVVTSSEVEDVVGDDTMNHSDAIAAITDVDIGFVDSRTDVENLVSTGEVALEDEEVDDDNDSVKVSVVELDDVDKVVDMMESPAVSVVELDEFVDVVECPALQLEANSVADEEVDDAGRPSIGGLEDSPTGDHADEAFPNLVNSAVTSTETVVDRALPKEEISSNNGDISALSSSMSAASASLTPPLKANDAVTLANLQSDDCIESTELSEPAGPDPGPNSNSLGTASAEADADSVQISTVAVSVPSAPLPEAIEVNDAATPSIQQLNDIYVAADPEPGISATTEICLSEENLAPSLCLVSAAASLAHSAKALAGGDDAYFVFENWFGVADGVGQWSFGGINKGLYAQEFLQNCESLARKSADTGLDSFKELFQQSAAMTESPGAARVLIAHIAEQVLHVANIGDTGFVIIRNGTIFMKSSPMFHEFNFPHAISSGDNPMEAVEEYHVELKDGDIIVTATDGLFDNLYEHEIASLVCEAVEDGKTLKEIAELLASRSQEVGRSPNARTPFADAAQAAGHPEFSGGKFDHVTVIVSAVQKE